LTFAHIVDLVLLDASILHDLLNGLHGSPEKVDVELLEFGTSKSLISFAQL
jgi:hypothetical protein